jgi:hypothetical protein
VISAAAAVELDPLHWASRHVVAITDNLFHSGPKFTTPLVNKSSGSHFSRNILMMPAPKYEPNATTGYNGFSSDDTDWYTIEKNALNETVDIALWDCVS